MSDFGGDSRLSYFAHQSRAMGRRQQPTTHTRWNLRRMAPAEDSVLVPMILAGALVVFLLARQQ